MKSGLSLWNTELLQKLTVRAGSQEMEPAGQLLCSQEPAKSEALSETARTVCPCSRDCW